VATNKNRTEKTGEHSGRQKLLDAAVKLFSEKGYALTSLDELAAEAGVSKGLVHKYFGGKDGLRKATDSYITQRRNRLFKEPLAAAVGGKQFKDIYEFTDPVAQQENEITASYMRGRLWEPPGEGTANYLRMVYDMYRDEIAKLKKSGHLREGIIDTDAYAMNIAYFAIGKLLLEPMGSELLDIKSKTHKKRVLQQGDSVMDLLLLKPDTD